jgi:hypothetical protein
VASFFQRRTRQLQFKINYAGKHLNLRKMKERAAANIVACRHIARQRQRKKQLYNKYLNNGFAHKHVSMAAIAQQQWNGVFCAIHAEML